MVRRLLRGTTFANVCSFLALTIALGTGTAYAANTVFSRDIVNGQVKSADIGKNQVTSPKIKTGAVTTSDIAAGAVDGSKVLVNSLTTADLAPDAVDSSKVRADSLTVADLAGADVNGGGISVPAGFVANGRCRQLEASVGGATAGEAVIFNVNGALQDGVVIYGQRVPSDGHVMFDVCNFSGTTQAAITDLPVRIITFG
jgi:hypothetical protein